jgi:hypothetical protein
MKLNNIEFRWSETNKSYELVKWEESKTCYVVAFFRKHKEGYNMETVGDRFFEDHDAWIVGKHALSFLNDIFNSQEFDAWDSV